MKIRWISVITAAASPPTREPSRSRECSSRAFRRSYTPVPCSRPTSAGCRARPRIVESRCPRIHPSVVLANGAGPPTSELTLVQVRQLCAREPKGDRARLPRFAVDESVPLECLDHPMCHRRRYSKEPLKIRFSRWDVVNLRVVVDEREI